MSQWDCLDPDFLYDQFVEQGLVEQELELEQLAEKELERSVNDRDTTTLR